MSGNGNNSNLDETCLEKKGEITLIDPFWADLSYLKPLCKKASKGLRARTSPMGLRLYISGQ